MIFETLKKETRSLHDEAEQYNDASKVLNHTITLPEYKELLVINYCSYYPLENVLIENIGLLPEALAPFAELHKANRLAGDLLNFDVAVTSVELPIFTFNATSVAHLVGIMYVIEGSMMGGMMISKQMQKCDSLQGIEAQLFFNRNVEAILKRWNSFKETVEALSFSGEEINQAVDGANAAFQFFKEAHLFCKQEITN